MENWQINDFLSQDNYRRLKKQTEEYWRFDEVAAAWDLYKKLDKSKPVWSKLNDEKLRQAYGDIKKKLAYIALPFLDNKEVEVLFREAVAEALGYNEEEYNFLKKVRYKVMLLPLAERDNYKAKLLKALEKNEERLTDSPLDKEGAQVEGSIKNWLADFRYYSAERPTDEKLARIEYLYKGKNVLKLGQSEREKVKKLVTLYNYLRKSSFTLEGSEEIGLVEKDGETYLMEDGKLIRLSGQPIGGQGIVKLKEADKKTALPEIQQKSVRRSGAGEVAHSGLKNTNKGNGQVADALQRLQANYKDFLGSELMRQALKAAEELWKSAGGDFKTLRGYFYHAVNHKQVEKAVGALLAIAKAGKIRQAFGEDERFVSFWSKYLAARGVKTESFKENPARVNYLAMFFKYILEERLTLNAEQAVMVGVTLANLARQAGESEYQSMAYADESQQSFKWQI